MARPAVSGDALLSPVMLIGQAPGPHEGAIGKPFAWTAGKTLFSWFTQIGMTEEQFRSRVFMAAVCRCFPGKNPGGGDRVPAPDEIANCSEWLGSELSMLRPRLVIAAGKLAIQRFIACEKLDEVVGKLHRIRHGGLTFDLAPLPHPSGASTWQHVQPGKTLLPLALKSIATHPAWTGLLGK